MTSITKLFNPSTGILAELTGSPPREYHRDLRWMLHSREPNYRAHGLGYQERLDLLLGEGFRPCPDDLEDLPVAQLALNLAPWKGWFDLENDPALLPKVWRWCPTEKAGALARLLESVSVGDTELGLKIGHTTLDASLPLNPRECRRAPEAFRSFLSTHGQLVIDDKDIVIGYHVLDSEAEEVLAEEVEAEELYVVARRQDDVYVLADGKLLKASLGDVQTQQGPIPDLIGELIRVHFPI